ncbi:MAG TPA: zinc ribbon domain-containing protein [Anaerolineaceae bacterium]
MDLGALLLILSILILVALFVTRPFINLVGESQTSEADDPLEHRRSETLAEYDRILTALQELDFDNALGKVPADEYPVQRAELLAAGAAALGKLDEAQVEVPDLTAEARIEAAIAARRADGLQAALGGESEGSAPVLVLEDDTLERMIAGRRQNREEKAGGFCPRCGRPVQQSDRFCPKCGARLGG